MCLESSLIPVYDDAKSGTSSGSINYFLHPKKRMRPLHDDEPDTPLVPKKFAISGNAKYKGVVQQQNGHWGAQIYTDHKRIWIGTFKSAMEAARAYDSASIKLKSFQDANSHRNFPSSEFTVHETDFQAGYTTEAVLNMIRDGSYQQKFVDFFRIRSQINIVGSKQSGGDEESNNVSYTHLFRKKLTMSDVGKLNRLVIPKRYAVKYLPLVSDDQNEREEGEIVEDVEVLCYDREMREWRFRYCYWKSSLSFVFTTGWKSFVKEKKLKEEDVIDFYTCHVKTLELGQSKRFLMIDVHRFSDDDSVVTDEEVDGIVQTSSEEEVKTESFFSDEETKSEEKKGGFMLFGVRIQ
ncbi:unnamed protein product [Microthlaspi erraticum]|uniref:AP2/ERF domain-containing protein n=1 Tax=Microthlaspi erraticum TaxID=1685480 RepID=A0A6D2I7P9_9BRAS|nr:unnamed protein product [Microthlaspi erraticum]